MRRIIVLAAWALHAPRTPPLGIQRALVSRQRVDTLLLMRDSRETLYVWATSSAE